MRILEFQPRAPIFMLNSLYNVIGSHNHTTMFALSSLRKPVLARVWRRCRRIRRRLPIEVLRQSTDFTDSLRCSSSLLGSFCCRRRAQGLSRHRQIKKILMGSKHRIQIMLHKHMPTLIRSLK